MEFSKLFGWILLFLGLGIILWALYFSFNIFTGKTLAPEIFKTERVEPLAPKKETPKTLEAQLKEKISQVLSEQLKKIFPTETFPKLLNLITWSIFAGILIFGGTQISTLGIKLIKK